ncbi:MAG: hypothetical protein OXN15_06895 [Chloroflexota bacterium]|nr:hypothetical protein [Chloroflexota bacterium]MDE2968892.1 hypothetical protein [Chloroflexota bacterium]
MTNAEGRTDTLARITVRLDGPAEYRGTEIIGDLRVIAETLYYPFKFVGFWDGQTGNHLCPQTQAGQSCPHPPGDAGRAAYASTVEERMTGELEVHFPHADLSIFLG